MLYSYEKFVEISMKMDKTNHLEDNVYAQLNMLRKQLNIPVIEVLKKTVIQKKESELALICKLLNKITEKSYDRLKDELFKLIAVIENIDDINKIVETIFGIASSNILYSALFAKLYTELIEYKSEFNTVFQSHFDNYLNEMNKLEYADPNKDYDEYCLYVKKVEGIKSLLTFFVNLMKNNVCSLDNIVVICLTLCSKVQGELDLKMQTEEMKEMMNSVHIIIKECIDYLLFNENLEKIHSHIISIQSHPSVTPKIRFKCMDILDIIRKYQHS